MAKHKKSKPPVEDVVEDEVKKSKKKKSKKPKDEPVAEEAPPTGTAWLVKYPAYCIVYSTVASDVREAYEGSTVRRATPEEIAAHVVETI